MSVNFSPASLFVARNWEIVTEIIAAERRLRGELERFLLSLEDDLLSCDWWGEDWVFRAYRQDVVYVSRECWRFGDDHLLWIGVERFLPERIFGSEDPAELFVWVAQRRYDLALQLAGTLDPEETLGEVDLKPNNGYVVRHAVQKCLPEAAEGYFAQAREQILAFFEHYAAMADAWDPITQRYLAQADDG